jgi:nucleoside 2-deoxyribosyltransferase
MAYKVFISSIRDDLELAKDLARRLEDAGVSVFSVEETVIPREKILTTVNRNLRKADEVMMSLTKDSGASPGLLSEFGMAYSTGKPVTPIVVNLDPENLPPVYEDMRYIKYADLSDYIAKLAARASLRKAS